MVQANTFLQPKVYIDDTEITSDLQGRVSFTGNNQLNKLTVKLSHPDIQHQALLYKKIKFFLNNGSSDTVPTFTGIITQVTPSEKETSITALDPRILISGKDGHKVRLTDTDNYDGYTVGAFLYSFITEYVNTEEKRLGVDMLTDTNPPISLTGQRTQRGTVYTIAKNVVKKVIDSDSDFLNPLTYFFDVIESEKGPQLVIKKEKALNEAPITSFTYDDGLIKYSYKRRTPKNTAIYKGGKFIYSNRPTGQSVVSINTTDFKKRGIPLESVAEQRQLAIEQVLLEQQEKDEISITVSKGYDLGLGSLVRLNIPEDDISGTHRVVGKSISFGNKITCTLKLNRKPLKLSTFIQ